MMRLFLVCILLLAAACHAPEDSPAPESNLDSDESASFATGAMLAAPDLEAAPAGVPDRFGDSVWEKNDWQAAPVGDRFLANAASSANRPTHTTRTTQATQTGTNDGVSIPVLCYHQVEADSKKYGGYNVPPEQFEAQLRTLKEQGYESLSQAEMLRALAGDTRGLPERGVFLTFDDGLISHYRTVAPLLKQYGFRGTLFLYPTVLSSKKKAYMNWDQVRELLRDGVFEVGSHSVYHPFLPELSDKELRRQMQTSRRVLEEKLDTSVRFFAYPFGLYDRRVIAAAGDAGYELAFTIHTGPARKNQERLALNRYMVTTGDSIKRFESYLRLEAPAEITLQPADGSHVRPGQPFTLYLPNVKGDTVQAKLGKYKIKLAQQGSVFKGQLPEFKSSRGYLTLEVRAKDQASGQSIFRRFLYLDAEKF